MKGKGRVSESCAIPDGAAEREVLTTGEAARYLSVTVDTLAGWRHRKIGPRHFKYGRLIRYNRSDLEAWMKGYMVEPQAARGA